MKLENQITNLTISRKLKKLGIKQESLWYYINDKYEKFKCNRLAEDHVPEWEVDDYSPHIPRIIDVLNDDNWSDWKNSPNIEIVSRFTCAELLNMIHYVDLPDNQYYPVCFKTAFKEVGKKWVIGDAYPLARSRWTTYADTYVNALGKMLIYLIENNFINLKEL